MVKKILGISSSQPDLRGGFGDHCKLAITPARTFAILTCVDERLDPANIRDSLRATPMSFANAGVG
jgi:hypothetical protein